MAKGVWILLVAIVLIACARSRLIDDYWKKTQPTPNYMILTLGNLTLWKAL